MDTVPVRCPLVLGKRWRAGFLQQGHTHLLAECGPRVLLSDPRYRLFKCSRVAPLTFVDQTPGGGLVQPVLTPRKRLKMSEIPENILIVSGAKTTHDRQVDVGVQHPSRAVHQQKISGTCVGRVETGWAAVRSIHRVLSAVNNHGRNCGPPVLTGGQRGLYGRGRVVEL